MSYTIGDRITDCVYGNGWFRLSAEDNECKDILSAPGTNPWNPDGEKDCRNEPDARIREQQRQIAEDEDEVYSWDLITFDPDKVEAEVRAYHARYKTSGFSGLELPFAYFVSYDGRWHHDNAQLYAILEDEPYLTPDEWLDKKIAMLKAKQNATK